MTTFTPQNYPTKLRRLTFWTRFHPKSRVSLTVAEQARKRKPEKIEPSENCLTKCFGDESTSETVQVNVDGYSIKEEKNWARAANFGAIGVLTICAYLYGFFA